MANIKQHIIYRNYYPQLEFLKYTCTIVVFWLLPGSLMVTVKVSLAIRLPQMSAYTENVHVRPLVTFVHILVTFSDRSSSHDPHPFSMTLYSIEGHPAISNGSQVNTSCSESSLTFRSAIAGGYPE